MAKEPSAPNDGSEKPVEGATRIENPSARNRAKPTPATTKPAATSGRAQVEGKSVRKDPPVGPSTDVTQAFAEDTVASQMPNDNEEAQMSERPVEKPSDSLEAPVAQGGGKGATILGDFKLLKKLGQGGMGSVYKAQQVSTGLIVAVKVLAKELASKEAYVLRFEREAKAMQKVDHPNILQCLDVGKAKNYHFFVMEFVEGGSIENWLRKLGRFSIGDALHIVLRTAEGLQHAHEKNIIHRDIKPDNILLTKEGVIKIADLGLAKDTDEETALTKTGAGAGTPIYMAPEQARDVKRVDCRVDIYALGVMLYVFLSGKAPFQGNTVVELTSAKEKGKFDPVRRHNDDVPPKIDLIIDKMLARDPKMRYASCAEVIKQLESLELANETLSFVETEETVIPPSSAKRAKKPAATEAPEPAQETEVQAPSPNKKPAQKTGTPNKGADRTNIQEEDESQKDIWYWNLVTPEGRKITKKVTTEQLRALIKAGHLDADAEVSRSMKTGFRAAASYAEFQPYFKSRETTTAANVKGKKFKDKMKEIAEEDERRRKYGWMSRMFKSAGGTLLGLLWITLILAIVGGGGYFFYVYVIAK